MLDSSIPLCYYVFSITKYIRVDKMEDRLLQQLKKGVLEMLVLEIICQAPTYGYELMARLKERSGDLFTLKEGTLYPILYRLEDDGMITANWSQGTGKTAPKKIYTATEQGQAERSRRHGVWQAFYHTVNRFYEEER